MHPSVTIHSHALISSPFTIFSINFPLQGRQKLPFASLQPAVTPGTLVQDLKWNPALGSMVAVCLSDGSMMVLDVTDRVTMQAQLPAANGITCSKL